MDNNFIKERIRYYRQKFNYSARNLSLEIGMCSEYVNQVETGRLNPSLDFIINFCEFFNISLSEFFDDSNQNPIENKEMLNVIKNLNRDQIDVLLKMCNLLTKTNNKN